MKIDDVIKSNEEVVGLKAARDRFEELGLDSVTADMSKLIDEADCNAVDRFDELKEKIEENETWINSLMEENKSYKDLFEYLTKNCLGSCSNVLKILSEESYWHVVGYVDVKKRLTDKGELYFDFKVPNEKEEFREHRSAKWEAKENIAVWQTRHFDDDWHGYILFPTFDDFRYLCVWFQD